VEQVRAIRLRDFWSRSGATIARISALPLFLMGSTGWIPNADLDVSPKGPWPWGAIIGLLLIAVGVVGVLLPQASSS